MPAMRVMLTRIAGLGMETAVTSCAGGLGILTMFWHDWIEALTGWDPDHHNGSVEWLIVAALLVVAAVLGALTRREWKLQRRLFGIGLRP
jgi:hypothetical protein